MVEFADASRLVNRGGAEVGQAGGARHLRRGRLVRLDLGVAGAGEPDGQVLQAEPGQFRSLAPVASD
jgi:hypothetical protein